MGCGDRVEICAENSREGERMTMGRVARVVAVAGMICSCAVLGPQVAAAHPAHNNPARPNPGQPHPGQPNPGHAQPSHPPASQPNAAMEQGSADSRPTGPGAEARQQPGASAPGAGGPTPADDNQNHGNLDAPGGATTSSAPAPAGLPGPAAPGSLLASLTGTGPAATASESAIVIDPGPPVTGPAAIRAAAARSPLLILILPHRVRRRGVPARPTPVLPTMPRVPAGPLPPVDVAAPPAPAAVPIAPTPAPSALSAAPAPAPAQPNPAGDQIVAIGRPPEVEIPAVAGSVIATALAAVGSGVMSFRSASAAQARLDAARAEFFGPRA